jgi:hypothetical protein
MEGGDNLDAGHAVAQEGAGGLDMRNVVCVAEATAAEMRNNAETQTEMSIASHHTFHTAQD